MTVDPYTAASPQYIAAQAKGTRRLPLIQMSDTRPSLWSVLIKFAAICFVFGLAIGVGLQVPG